MRRQDEEQADRKTEEALVADTVGAQIPRSSASATDASPALGIRPRLTLTVAAILAFVAIGAVWALTWHASGARENDERLDDVIVNVNELQGTPWRLQTSQINGQSLPVAQLRARMTTAEQAVLRQLDALNHGSQIPEITRARALLQINFAALVSPGRPCSAPTMPCSQRSVTPGSGSATSPAGRCGRRRSGRSS
jgi:hypothetical protein